ncbi:uncharacterized protein LOC119120249 isoform X3 [Syngnathus acus]|uniref:uncharacterized protein LOC119120249 isoform X3 n=1 Tax=Syngnathus acus TaxID=161584 RepID=UPI0018861F22|nr:uncharacterized protein LOC119120249 isoform X3 [Syngnathus acus]
MCSRGAAQCEEGLCATKERRGQLPDDAVFNETPLVVHAADVTEGDLGSWRRQQLQSLHIKQEEWPKPCHIKEEEEEEQEDEITTFQLTDVSVKFEEGRRRAWVL